MATKTKAQLEQDYEELKVQHEELRTHARKLADRQAARIEHLEFELERRDKKRDAVDWPSIERMLKPWGFDPKDPRSLRRSICRLTFSPDWIREMSEGNG